MSIPSLDNEPELVTAMQAGNAEAFSILYRHYSPHLYLNMLRMVKDAAFAQEMLQELFTRIWHKKEQLNLQPNLAGYLTRSAQHLVHDFYQKLQRDRNFYERFAALAEANYTHIEEAIHLRESSGLLEKALSALSPQQQKVYRLIKIDGHSYKETAELLGISADTVKEYLVSANKTIRLYISNNLDGTLSLILLAAIKAVVSYPHHI